MYICNRCNDLIESLPVITEHHPYGSGEADEELLDCDCDCGGTYEDAQTCPRCGEYFPNSDDCMFCDECIGEINQIINDFIIDNFDETEQDYIYENYFYNRRNNYA